MTAIPSRPTRWRRSAIAAVLAITACLAFTQSFSKSTLSATAATAVQAVDHQIIAANQHCEVPVANDSNTNMHWTQCNTPWKKFTWLSAYGGSMGYTATTCKISFTMSPGIRVMIYGGREGTDSAHAYFDVPNKWGTGLMRHNDVIYYAGSRIVIGRLPYGPNVPATLQINAVNQCGVPGDISGGANFTLTSTAALAASTDLTCLAYSPAVFDIVSKSGCTKDDEVWVQGNTSYSEATGASIRLTTGHPSWYWYLFPAARANILTAGEANGATPTWSIVPDGNALTVRPTTSTSQCLTMSTTSQLITTSACEAGNVLQHFAALEPF